MSEKRRRIDIRYKWWVGEKFHLFLTNHLIRTKFFNMTNATREVIVLNNRNLPLTKLMLR